MTDTLNKAQPYAIGVFRIVVGLLFACHGAASLFGVLGGATGDGGTLDAGTWPGWYAAVIQLVGGCFVLLGLGTRVAALVASGSMAYAYFKVHQPEALWPLRNGGESAAMYCWALVLFVFTGSGALGLDRFFGTRKARSTADSGTADSGTETAKSTVAA